MTAPLPISERSSLQEEKLHLTAAASLLKTLRALVADLGKDGGLQNGAVYDTAMVVRLAPPAEGAEQALDWLLKQRHSDGGWEPNVPRARDSSTLAAVLALHKYVKDNPRKEALSLEVQTRLEKAEKAVQDGLEFIRKQRGFWTVLPDDLLVGVELTLPRLLTDAKAAGLDVPEDQYAALKTMGERRRAKLRRMRELKHIKPGTPPVHSWEGWGEEPDSELLDASGGLGLSPAATAAWLHMAGNEPTLKDACDKARNYLKAAEKGCVDALDKQNPIPGVVPASWPIDLMEQQWGLFALLCGGLLNNPLLAEVVNPHLDHLVKVFAQNKGTGIGFTEFFMPDGDCTAVTVALLNEANRPVDSTVIDRFAQAKAKAQDKHLQTYEFESTHFQTYEFESTPSLTTTAHAVMALKRCNIDTCKGQNTSVWVDAMWDKRTAEGRWLLDKWQTSWIYTTTHVMFAIEDPMKMVSSIITLLKEQKEDGGWGSGQSSTLLETALAVLVLHWLLEQNHKKLARETQSGARSGDSTMESLLARAREIESGAQSGDSLELLLERVREIESGAQFGDSLELLLERVREIESRTRPDDGLESILERVMKKDIKIALRNADKYMTDIHSREASDRTPLWIAKSIYYPSRMDRAFVLSARLALALQPSLWMED